MLRDRAIMYLGPPENHKKEKVALAHKHGAVARSPEVQTRGRPAREPGKLRGSNCRIPHALWIGIARLIKATLILADEGGGGRTPPQGKKTKPMP
jgi:hypothetical protein